MKRTGLAHPIAWRSSRAIGMIAKCPPSPRSSSNLWQARRRGSSARRSPKSSLGMPRNGGSTQGICAPDPASQWKGAQRGLPQRHSQWRKWAASLVAALEVASFQEHNHFSTGSPWTEVYPWTEVLSMNWSLSMNCFVSPNHVSPCSGLFLAIGPRLSSWRLVAPAKQRTPTGARVAQAGITRATGTSPAHERRKS